MSVTIIRDLARAVLEQQEHHAARRKAEAERKAKENSPTGSETSNPSPDSPTTDN